MFATLTELQDRLEWDLDSGEQKVAAFALESLSDDARTFGREDWPEAPAAPRQVRNIVLKAAARYMRNPDGYITSRAGDETVTFTDRGHGSGSPEFTRDEIRQIQRLAGQRGLVSVLIVHGSDKTTEREGLVPVDYGGKKFPLYSSDESPW